MSCTEIFVDFANHNMYTDNKKIRQLFFVFSDYLQLDNQLRKYLFPTLNRFNYHNPSAHRSHICSNKSQKRIWWFFQKYKGRDRENIILSLSGFNLVKQIAVHHQVGYCEVGSKRIIFLQIAFFWIRGGLENNYATISWSTALLYTDEKKILEILIL